MHKLNIAMHSRPKHTVSVFLCKLAVGEVYDEVIFFYFRIFLPKNIKEIGPNLKNLLQVCERNLHFFAFSNGCCQIGQKIGLLAASVQKTECLI
jgi:hypothetical protein